MHDPPAQVRRMMEAFGTRILNLQRVAFAGLQVAGIRAGAWRWLTKEEIGQLKQQQKAHRHVGNSE